MVLLAFSRDCPAPPHSRAPTHHFCRLADLSDNNAPKGMVSPMRVGGSSLPGRCVSVWWGRGIWGVGTSQIPILQTHKLLPL